MIEIFPNENNDKDFIKLVSEILNNSISLYKPNEIYIIEIDHWFDDKWLAFSGKALGVIPQWNARLTVPAFNPNRVISETFYERVNNSFVKSETRKLHIAKQSSGNLINFLDEISESGLFVWYSGDTTKLDRGSLMIYWTSPEIEIESKKHINDWYDSFQKQTNWKLKKLKGISQNEFSGFLGNIRNDQPKRILSPHLANKSDAKNFEKFIVEDL